MITAVLMLLSAMAGACIGCLIAAMCKVSKGGRNGQV